MYPLQFSIVWTVRPHEAVTEPRKRSPQAITGPKVGRSADVTLWGGQTAPCVRPIRSISASCPISAKSTAHLPQPSATSGHGELHELHVAKSTAENKQKGNQATMHGGSSSLLLVYFVAEVQRHLQARHMYYSVSCGSSGLVWTDTFLERKTFLISNSVCSPFRFRVNGVLI